MEISHLSAVSLNLGVIAKTRKIFSEAGNLQSLTKQNFTSSSVKAGLKRMSLILIDYWDLYRVFDHFGSKIVSLKIPFFDKPKGSATFMGRCKTKMIETFLTKQL